MWHCAVGERFERSVEISLGNRRDSESPIRGGILTESVITLKDGAPSLMIWYDPLEIYYEDRINELGYSRAVIDEMTDILGADRDTGPDYDPVLNPGRLNWDKVARQTGRWILKVRGFKKLHNENRNMVELETFLNLECGIPALYSLFEEAGFDRTAGEHKRLEEVYEGLRNMKEPSKRLDRTINALRIANLLKYGNEEDEKEALKALLEERFERTAAVAVEINDMRADYKLDRSDELDNFMRKLVLKYRMPGSWTSLDETVSIF